MGVYKVKDVRIEIEGRTVAIQNCVIQEPPTTTPYPLRGGHVIWLDVTWDPPTRWLLSADAHGARERERRVMAAAVVVFALVMLLLLVV